MTIYNRKQLTVLFAVILLSKVFSVSAQELEPRAYSNAPVGLNFVLLGYQRSQGGLLFDPSVPITDADSDINVTILGYLRTLDIAGMSAKAGIVLPYADLAASGLVSGVYQGREKQMV